MGRFNPPADVPSGLAVGRCPICQAPSDIVARPFCSRRCADVDLSRWLRGGYAIAGSTDDDEDGDDPSAGDTPARDRDDDQPA